MHGEIAQCLRMVARLCYVTGEHREAMAYQQKAVLMSERVNGIDHPYTITEYVSNYIFSRPLPSTNMKSLFDQQQTGTQHCDHYCWAAEKATKSKGLYLNKKHSLAL